MSAKGQALGCWCCEGSASFAGAALAVEARAQSVTKSAGFACPGSVRAFRLLAAGYQIRLHLWVDRRGLGFF